MKATLEDLQLELWLRNRNNGALVWTTKEGNDVPLKDMSDQHLVNTINMIKRAKHAQEVREELNSIYSSYRELEEDCFWRNLLG